MWDFRARAEREAAAHYEDLARRLKAGGAAATMGDRVAAAGADEVRHRVLCAQMAERFGHLPAPAAPAVVRRIAPHGLEDGARLAYEMVALFCVSESIDAALLLRSWEKAQQAETRALLHELLADEVAHSQLGWAYASSLPAWRDDVAVRLPIVLAATTHDEHFLDDPSPRAPSGAHGPRAAFAGGASRRSSGRRWRTSSSPDWTSADSEPPTPDAGCNARTASWSR